MKAKFTMTIGSSKVRPERLDINISRLSLQTGYSVSHLSRIFSKKTTPSVNCLKKLAEVLKTDITNLYKMINEGAINVG